MSRPTRAYPVLPVQDIPSALAFYLSLDGIQLHWQDEGAMAAVGDGEVTLFLNAASPMGPSEAILNVENADRAAELWAKAGAEIVDPVETRSWGMREFTMRDPFGNIIRVGHVDESKADYTTFDGPAVDG